jgi:hypothetical protein
VADECTCPDKYERLQGKASTNSMAIAGFVLSFLIPILGLIFSWIALSQIKKSGEKGKGLATAGLIISIIPIALAILFFVVFLIIFAVA